MSFNRVKKVNPRIRGTELFTYISANTSLTRSQARECFKAYAKMIKEISSSKHADKGLTITLPYVGQFFYEKRKGRKGGSTYKLFDNDKVVTLDKSEPSFFQIRFKVYRTLYEKVKEKTKHYE